MVVNLRLFEEFQSINRSNTEGICKRSVDHENCKLIHWDIEVC